MRSSVETQKEDERAGRRNALKRLGLGVAVAYVAPTVLHLDRTGNASVSPSCNYNSKGNPWCGKGGGGKGGK